MASRSQFPDRANFEPEFKTREECLTAMQNKSSQMTIPHCQPDWDRYSEMCWAPTPAGETAMLPCPDDGYLNPNQFASRMCLSDGSWFINYTFDDKPYTNFNDCFLPADPSAENDLKMLVDTKIIFILKSMDEYKKVYLPLHAISIILLIAAIIASTTGFFKLSQKRNSTLSYLTLTIAAAALLISNVATVSLSALDDATKITRCRGAKWLVLVSTLVFHECILAYIYLCIVPILQITIRQLLIKTVVSVAIILTVLLTTVELLMEMFSCSTRYCGFRTLQSTFHWLTTAPRLLLIMLHVSLGFVTVFGAFCLRHPYLGHKGELCHIRQKILSALALVLYNVIMEILLVLIHTEAYMGYSDLPVDEYLNAFSFVTAAHGTLFSVVMCFSDLGVLAMLGLSLKCSQLSSTGNERELKAIQMHPVSPGPSNTDNSYSRDHEYEAVPKVDVLSADSNRMNLAFPAERSEESQNKLYESNLFFGLLK